jgi:Arc/MetJ family transcription regulator
MRTTIALDDTLVAKAQAFTGLTEKSSLVREALNALIERESASRLARLGGARAASDTRQATSSTRVPARVGNELGSQLAQSPGRLCRLIRAR